MVSGLRSWECAAFFVAALATVAAAPSDDEKAIRVAAKAYQDALARGDGKAIAALWTADGDIIDEQGTVTKGRDTAALIVVPTDGQPAQQVQVTELQLRMLTPDAAIEDGSVSVTPPGGTTPLTGRYTATWVRQNGQWKIASLREYRTTEGDAAGLADLDWMVGDWTVVDNAAKPTPDKTPPPRIEINVRWNATKTFLLRDMRVFQGPAQVAHVTQRIGWNPLTKQLQAWMFDATGAHGEGVWTKDGDAWVARTTAVQPDGSRTSSLNVYRYDGKDRCSWQSFHTHVGGEHLPPVNMTMIRASETASK